MRIRSPFRSWRMALLTVALLLGMFFSFGLSTDHAQAASKHENEGGYQQTNLISDLPGLAQQTDPNLVNPWGIVAGPTTPFWISDNNAGVSTLYTGQGQPVPLVVSIPAAPGNSAGTPTGVVFNGQDEFHVSKNGTTGASLFIFASEDGIISGWNPQVDPTHAIVAVNNSSSAVYKGLTLVRTSRGDFLYAANIHAGTIDVFDQSFAPVHFFGNFIDRHLPQGYAPFNIASLNGLLYVSYAKQNAQKDGDVAGEGHGIIDVFDVFGDFLFRLVSHGRLNSPWGMAMAPANFGAFSRDLLVGNFGNGHINVYDPFTGHFEGELKNQQGEPIVIDHLWGLTFGNGNKAGPTNTLFFTAGIDDEAHGLFGTIVAAGAQ